MDCPGRGSRIMRRDARFDEVLHPQQIVIHLLFGVGAKQPRARPAAEGKALRGRVAWVANGSIRTDSAAAGSGSRFARPL